MSKSIKSGLKTRETQNFIHRDESPHRHTWTTGLPVFVDERVEGHAVPPARAEVVDVDVGIPEEEDRKQRLT